MSDSNNKKVLFVLIGLALIIGVGFLFFNSRTIDLSENTAPTLTPAEQSPLYSIPANWRTYTNPKLGFSMKYDPELKMDEDAESVRWYAWGPTQSEGTEVYDGFIVSLSRTDYSGDLDEYIDQQIQIFREVGEITADIHDIIINGIRGRSFKGSSLGEYTITFLPIDEDSVLVISSMAPDPGNLGYQDKIDSMLSTLQIVQ